MWIHFGKTIYKPQRTWNMCGLLGTKANNGSIKILSYFDNKFCQLWNQLGCICTSNRYHQLGFILLYVASWLVSSLLTVLYRYHNITRKMKIQANVYVGFYKHNWTWNQHCCWWVVKFVNSMPPASYQTILITQSYMSWKMHNIV